MPRKHKSPIMTEERAAHIKWLWENTPLNQAQISACLGAINQGRVSEVINGQRFPEVSPQAFEGWQSYV
jgi:predicted XRE-type DNA-binding protein